MTRISAESNITIEVQPESWRMLANGAGAERLLMEANAFELRYAALFAVQRRLPEAGRISSAQVQRVVAGWSPKDAAWHLGVMLSQDLAETRGSRWVEIASWSDPSSLDRRAEAEEAGSALATRMQRPFSLVPPKGEVNGAVAAAAYTPSVAPAYPGVGAPRPVVAAPAVRPSLPIRLERWTISELSPNIIEIKRASSWRSSGLLRAIWYVLWAAIFVLLSYASLTSGIAPPQPEFLPYIGFGAAALLVLLAINALLRSARRINRYVFDGPQKMVSGMQGQRIRWQMGLEQIQGLYVSEVVGKVSARKPQRQVHLAEFNLLLNGDTLFQHLFTATHLDEKIPAAALGLAGLPPEATDERIEVLNTEAILPLDGGLVISKARAAGWLMAQTLGVPAHYDQRLK